MCHATFGLQLPRWVYRFHPVVRGVALDRWEPSFAIFTGCGMLLIMPCVELILSEKQA